MPDQLPSAYAERVLDVVGHIPAGQVLAYGDIAELVEEAGPRQVGRVMALWGGSVQWWRVVRADGRPAQGHEVEALQRLRAEGVPLAPAGDRVDMSAARWEPVDALELSDPRGGLTP